MLCIVCYWCCLGAHKLCCKQGSADGPQALIKLMLTVQRISCESMLIFFKNALTSKRMSSCISFGKWCHVGELFLLNSVFVLQQ